MSQECEASVLLIGQMQPSSVNAQVDLITADTGGRAIELLRMLKFDLIVIGQKLTDMPVWNLVQRIRMTMPGQKWAFVGRDIDQREEVMARSLGVVGVFDAESDWNELLLVADRIHRRASGSGQAERLRMVSSN
jgi:DNA-binding response OmpR family regulator